ncbi:MAG: hypothetical protein MPN21_03235 [Thermoanaerobaculia bacterium]|nr:hypothetical protein [Thermoanaerobaculia bacterium]
MAEPVSNYAISPWKSRLDYPKVLAYEDLVEIFYDQTLGWQLGIADLMMTGGAFSDGRRAGPRWEHAGFAATTVCLSYFELVGMILANKTEGDAFRWGVREVSNKHLSEPAADRLFTSGRCGFYHAGRARRAVRVRELEDGGFPIQYDPSAEIITVDAFRLPRALIQHLDGLRVRLLEVGPGKAPGEWFKDWMSREFDVKQKASTTLELTGPEVIGSGQSVTSAKVVRRSGES